MAAFDVFNPLANVTTHFTQEQLEDVEKFFTKKAKLRYPIEGGGPIPCITVKKLMLYLKMKKFHRRYYHYPTYLELMIEVEKLNGSRKLITHDQFIYLLDLWFIDPELKHEVVLAFEVFDTEKRKYLDIDEIRVIVTEYGNIFSEEEVQEMIYDADVNGTGLVNYEDFVESMFSVAPELYKIRAEYLFDDPNEDPSVPPEPVVEEEEEEPPHPHAMSRRRSSVRRKSKSIVPQ